MSGTTLAITPQEEQLSEGPEAYSAMAYAAGRACSGMAPTSVQRRATTPICRDRDAVLRRVPLRPASSARGVARFASNELDVVLSDSPIDFEVLCGPEQNEAANAMR